MSEEYNRGLFHKWVPGLGQLGLIMLFEAIMLLINPINPGNIGQMSGSTGILTEYYMWGNFATIIGLSLVLPFVLRVKMRFRSKELLVMALVVMAVLNVIVATTTIGEIVVVACLFFGMAKMVGMVEMLLPIQGILSPDGNRNRFYAIFYPISLSASQVGTFFTSKFALDIGWQAVNYYGSATLLLAALIAIIFVHNQRFGRKIPFYRIDWPGLLCFGTALMSMAYICAFGKQQDWFNSPHVIRACIIIIVSVFALIMRQLNTRHPFLAFKLYRIREVRVGVLLLVGQGMFMGVSSIMSIYTTAILGYNWMTNAEINLMTLPGIISAGFVAYYWTKHGLHLKMYIFSGFAAYFLYTVMLYFMMVPELNISQLYLPQVLNGYGMSTLFISVWIYTFYKVPQNTMLPSVAPIMIFRSFVMLGFFTALFGWLQYKFQWQSIGDLAVHFDLLVMNQNSGIGSLRDTQMSAILASNKTLLGYIIIAGLGILSMIFFYQFGQEKYRLVRFNSRRSEKQNELSGQIKDIAGSV
ncbi:hypothetical protein [uncultured Proteiniphilum sp.]|uniref:hypothetical protein n=1 Tax=uncultured Proteiniphilum sp. TaxID=497637 RepID=UPI00261D8CC3|nr:hypothetical protein [uncultured Proteiniphilum sp.]